MRFTLAATCLLAQLVISAAVWAEQRVTATDLERGTTSQRLSALATVLDVSPDRRDAAIWSALEGEAKRMLGVLRRRKPGDTDQSDVESAYAAGIVRALTQKNDIRLISIFVDYSGIVSYATQALIAFGDSAVPAILTAEQAATNDLNQKGGVTNALAELVKNDHALSERSLDSIENWVESLKVRNSKLEMDEVVNLASIALLCRRPDLRAEVERLVGERDAWTSHGVTDSFEISFGQRILRAKLTAAPQS